MPNFSDADDRMLYQLALQYTRDGVQIKWSDVAKAMSTSSKTLVVLQERLKTLKKTHSKSLDQFPAYFHRPVGLQAAKRPPHRCTKHQVRAIVECVFESVSRKDIMQGAGIVYQNASEIATVGVSELLTFLGLTVIDNFCDIGSGVGYILVQVALESDVGMCSGVEVRVDLATLSRQLVNEHATRYPALSKTKIVDGDISSPSPALSLMFSECTVLLSNNVLFEPSANNSLEICNHSNLTHIAIFQRFCNRHRPINACARIFYSQWEEAAVVPVDVMWSSKKVSVYIFVRR